MASCEAELRPAEPQATAKAVPRASAPVRRPERIELLALPPSEARAILEKHKPPSLEPALHIGARAPTLAVEGWLRGPEIGITPGRVLVVENWATWCKPCIEAMPHLSAMAKTYRKKGLEILAINVQESGLDSVRSFVSEREAEMDYPVAYESAGTMQRTWIAAAGMAGLPATFVVDRNGVIAWAGHPTELDSVIGAIVEGTWDVAKARRRAERKRLVVPYASKAVALLAEDSENAYKLIRALMGDLLASNSEFLQALAYHIYAAPNVALRDLDIAYAAASMAGGLEGWERPKVVELMSKIRETQGRRDEAIELQRYAVQIAPKSARMEERLSSLQAGPS